MQEVIVKEEEKEASEPLYSITIGTPNDVEKLLMGNHIHSQLRGNIDYVENNIVLNIDTSNVIELDIFPEHKTPLLGIDLYFPDTEFNDAQTTKLKKKKYKENESKKKPVMADYSMTNYPVEGMVNYHLNELKDKLIKMIDFEIEDVTGTISNEKLWALGSKDENEEKMHLSNVEYLSMEKTKLDAIKHGIDVVFDINKCHNID